MRLTNNPAVDIVLALLFKPQRLSEGGKWYRIGNTLNQITSADEAVAICKAKHAECQAGELRCYWVEPDKNVDEMTRALEQADNWSNLECVHAFSKAISFTFDAVAQVVEESGTKAHCESC